MRQFEVIIDELAEKLQKMLDRLVGLGV